MTAIFVQQQKDRLSSKVITNWELKFHQLGTSHCHMNNKRRGCSWLICYAHALDASRTTAVWNHPLACKIFDTMISPVLTYNSEVWGVFIKSDFKYWDTSSIEKGHLQFCKRYLQVNNKASNIACWAELGRYPLIFKTSFYTIL